MDGQLSQDEINALLAGMTTDDGGGGGDAPAADAGPAASGGGGDIDDTLLTDVEKDAIGEIANINMGSSATTLFSLVNHKVDITTPNVELSNWQGVVSAYERPCVFITIKYTIGVDGSNVLILKEHDVMVITDLMMGGDGTNTEGEVGELQLSAISEAMNQVMGAAATSLSTMIGEKVDISPPVATLEDFADQDPGKIAEFLTGTFVKISFQMKIGDLVDSVLMQLYPIDFAKSLYDTFNTGASSDSAASSAPEPAPAPAAAPPPAEGVGMVPPPPAADMGGAPPPMAGPMPQAGYGMPMPMMGQPMANMNVQPAQFQSFGVDMSALAGGANIQLIHDVPLDVTVELGRTIKPISDILDFSPGTIIELDKIAGEPVDVLVNGKYVAKGEVVVIEESFGVRVTEIIK
ncbi:MAG: flagellar motor switch phosphatase FliY [Lachnospiraceae bacterium]|nr:flagellar motor switch phosphatase FliY [Lachnospiraceae bacterium]